MCVQVSMWGMCAGAWECVHICVRTFTCVHAGVCAHVRVQVCLWGHVCRCVGVCVHVCAHLCVRVHVLPRAGLCAVGPIDVTGRVEICSSVLNIPVSELGSG